VGALGVLPEFIEPGRPDQNGRHERMHRTLKAATTRPAAGSLAAQQRRFNEFRDEFNHERPHEALDQQTPASCYAPSARPMPAKLPALEYPDRFEVRYVSANGGIRWNRRWVKISSRSFASGGLEAQPAISSSIARTPIAVTSLPLAGSRPCRGRRSWLGSTFDGHHHAVGGWIRRQGRDRRIARRLEPESCPEIVGREPLDLDEVGETHGQREGE